MNTIQKMAPCLWFDGQGEEAANFYVGIFNNARLVQIARYCREGHEIHHRPAGSVMTAAFELDGQPFTALNGGPEFRFSEAISFQVFCDRQEKINGCWNQLSADSDPESPSGKLAFKAMMNMKKLNIAELERAYAGQSQSQSQATFTGHHVALGAKQLFAIEFIATCEDRASARDIFYAKNRLRIKPKPPGRPG